MAHLPADSATVRSIDPDLAETASWTLTNQLLALVFDSLQWVNWRLANMGAKSPSPRPTPLPRPGIEPQGTHKGTPVPIDQLDALLPGIESVDGNDGDV